MPNVQIPVVGPTYKSRSRSVANQLTQNFFIEAGQNSDTPATLHGFPGLKLYSSIPGNRSRGLGVYKNELYGIVDSDLYKISSDATSFFVGVLSGTNRCVLQQTTNDLVITNGQSKPYSYNGTTLTLGTDADLTTSSTVDYINNRVVYDGDNADLIFADLGSPLSVNSVNVTAVDKDPDNTLAVKKFGDQIFAFGEQSVVPYYNVSSGNPPYIAVQNATYNVGLGAIHSIDRNYIGMYFLGADRGVYRIRGLQPELISDASISQAMESYASANIANAYGVCMKFDNSYLYLLTVPNEATWLYSEGLGWTNLSYSVDGSPHLIYDYAYVYGRHLVSSRLDGNIYELDFDTFTDNSQTIERVRQTKKITGKELGFPGKEIFMESLELVIEPGVGLETGQGEVPLIALEYSDDGGFTWTPPIWAEMGRSGSYEYAQNPRWYDLGSFYERQFRFTVTDPVRTVIISANADIEVGV